MPKCLANAQKLDPKWSNVTSSQPIMLWRIKFEVNSTNSRQLCRTDRSHFWQDFYDTKFRSEFGVWQQYSPRRLHDSLPSKSFPGLKYKFIIWSQALLFRSLKHKTIFQNLLDILIGIKEKSNFLNMPYFLGRGFSSNPKMEYQVFLCIFQKNSAMAT